MLVLVSQEIFLLSVAGERGGGGRIEGGGRMRVEMAEGGNIFLLLLRKYFFADRSGNIFFREREGIGASYRQERRREGLPSPLTTHTICSGSSSTSK